MTFKSGLHGRVFGESKTVIWFVHGWDSRTAKYSPLIKRLIESKLQVVAWDGPAHGDHPEKETNLVHFGEALKSDIEAFDRPIAMLIGHSFGGGASAYACSLGAPVPRLVMIAAPSLVLGVFTRFWDLITLGPKAREVFVAQIRRRTTKTPEDASAARFMKDLKQMVLVIHDEDDKEIPFSDTNAYLGLDHVRVVKTTGLGHRRIIASPMVATEIIEFAERAEISR